MKKFLIYFLLVAELSAVSLFARVAASVPAPKQDKDGHFLAMHESFLKRAKEGPIDLLFLGDSITERWAKAPKVWDAHYGKYNAANFGIGGDCTQHVLWRIENGELDGIHPRVLVLLIGTNNSGTNTKEEILEADQLIIQKIREKLPETKILLLAIFPRGPRQYPDGRIDTGAERMEKIRWVNAGLAKLDNGTTIRFLDLTDKFLVPDGTIPKEVMPDQLHPNVKGYEIWAEAMQPLLDEMMGTAKP